MHGFVSEEGIRHYVVTDGAYEMTLNWCDEDGKKCTIIINIDANGIELIERNRVTDDQLKANKDVKIGNLFLYQIKFRNKEKGNHKSSEIVIENSNRNINIQTTQEIERGIKEAQIGSTKMQDKIAQVVDDSLNERINKLEKENTRLTEDKETMSEQLQQKVREIEELNGKVRQLNEVLAEITQKFGQLSDSVESEFEEKRIEKEKLNKKLREMQEKIQQLSKEKQNLEEYAEGRDVRVKRLKDQIRKSEYGLAESMNENKRLEQELNDAQKKLSNKDNEIQRLKNQSHELESKKVTELMTCLEKKEKKIAELEAQLQKESSETYDLILKSSDSEEEKRRLQEKLNEKTQEVIKLTVDLEELSKQSEEKETKYFSRIKELEKILNKERKNSEKLENYSINLEEESQIQHEKYKELLFEKHSIKEEISDLNDQSSLVHQNRVSLAQDLAKNMIYLFKENVREGDKVIISQETVLEILNRLEELIKNVGVSDQEIKGVIEEISVQTNDSLPPSDISNGDLSALPNKELDEASYSEDFGYSSRCSTPRCSTPV
ncbi:coiled-coil domain-containing protein [Wolbachia endosymbiont (group B) of Camptogramma bilineatum]|uniref:hypothetical protein n=1 Tax=Wolbachia endosymbiont (group B) of Camptogramma bilineatum TaxID=2953991 RepID=UPI00223155E5|nr:hypothetical protein [Wolbachia endosymbiont (group B) of Camptogramma bilineatum]